MSILLVLFIVGAGAVWLVSSTLRAPSNNDEDDMNIFYNQDGQ